MDQKFRFEYFTGVKRSRDASVAEWKESKSKRIKLTDLTCLFTRLDIYSATNVDATHRLTGHKRRVDVLGDLVYSAGKRVKHNPVFLLKRLKTPFDTLVNFEPYILNIISSYGSPWLNSLCETHHHWWFVLGLSNNVEKAWRCAESCQIV